MTSYFLSENKQSIQEEEKEIPARLISWKHRDQAFEIKVSHSCHDAMGQPTGTIAAISFLDNPSPWYLAWLRFNSSDVIRPYSVEILSRLPKFTSLGGVKSGINSIYNVPLRLHAVVSQDQQIDSEETEAEDEASMNIQDEGAKAQPRDEEKTKDKRRKKKQQQEQPRGRIILYMCMFKGTEYFESSPIAEQGETIGETAEQVESEQGEALRLSMDVDEETFTSSTEYSTVVETWQIQRGRNNQDDDDADTTTSGKDQAKSKRGARRIYADGGVRFVQASTNLADTLPSSLDDLTNVLSQSDQYMDNYVNLWRGPERRGLVPNSAVASFGSYVTAMSLTTTLGDLQWNFGPRSGTNVFERKEFFKGQTGSGAFSHERGQVFCMPNALFLIVEKGRIGAGVFAERQVYIQLPGVASGVRQVNKPATLINNVYVSNNNKYGTPTSLYGGKILDIWHDSERLYVYELCAKGLVQAPFPAAAKDDSIVLGLQSYTTSGRLALRPTIFKPVPVSLTSAAAIVQIFQLGHYTDEQIMSMTNSLFWFWTWSLIQDPERTKYVDSLQEKNIFKFWDVTQVKQNLCASWSAWMTHLLGSFGGFQSSPAPGTAVISSTLAATTIATADKRAQDIEAKTGNQARKKYAILQNALSSAEMAKQLQTLKVAGPTSARYQVTVSMEALEQMLDLVQLSEIKDLVHQLCTFPLGQAREWYKRAMATARGETQMLDLTDMIQNTGPLQCIALTAADLADVLGMPDSLMVAETLDRILVHVSLPGLSGLSSIKKIEQDQAPKQQRLFVSELVTLFVRALVANHVRMETAISRSSARGATAVVPGFPGFTLATKINKAESKETKENTRDVQKGISITITMAGETDQTVWITNLDKFIDKLVDQILVLLHVTIGKNEQGAEPIRDGRIISIGQNTFYDVASATAMANITDADPTVLKNNRRPWWIFSRASMREQVSKMILLNVTSKGSIGGGSGIGGASAGTSTGAAGTTVLSGTPNAATRTLTLRLASNRDELPRDAYFDSATVVSRSTTVDAQVRETSRSIHRVLFERTTDPKIYKDTNTVFFDAVSKFFSSKESFTTLENRYERVMSGLLYLANSLDIVSSVSSASATTSLSLSSASNSSISSSSFPFNTASSIDVCIWPDGTTRKFPEAAQILGMQRLLRVSNVESERENEIFHVHCTRFKSRNRPWNLGDAETETVLSWSVAQKDQETDKDKRLSKTYWSTVSRIAEDFAKLSYGNSLSSASIPRLIIKDPEGTLAIMVSESKQVTLARVAKLGLGDTTDTVLWGRSSASGVSLGGSKSQQDAENQDQDEEQLGSGIFALVQQKYIQPIQPKAEPTMNQTLHFWMTSTLAQLLRAYKPTDPVMRFDTPREMLKGAILTVLRTRFRVNQNAAHIDKSVKQVRANITASKNRLRLKRQNERDKNKVKSESSSLGLDLDETRNKMDLRDDQEDEEKEKDQDEETKTEQKRTRTLKGRQARKPARKGFFHEILIKNYFRVLGQDEQTKSTHRSTSKGRDPTSSELIHLLLRWGIFHVALEGLVALMDVELLDLQDPDQIDELKQKQVEAQQEYQDAIASVKDAETARNAVEADKNSFKKLFTERGQSSNTGRKNNRFKQDIGSGSSSAAMADVWELRFRPSEPIEKRQSIARVILSTGNKDAMINDLAVAALDAMPPGSVPDDLAALAQEWKTKRASIGSGSGSASSVSNISKNSQEQDNDIDMVMNTIPPLESGSGSESIADQVQVKEETEKTEDAMTDIAKEEEDKDKEGDDAKGDDAEKKRIKNTEQKPKGRRGAPMKSEAEKAETKQRRLELTKLLATLKTKEAKEEAKAKFKQNRAEEMAKKKAQAKAIKDEAKTKAKKESKKLSSASATKVKKEPKVTKRKRVSTKKSSTDDDNDGGGDKKIPTSSEETLKPAKKRGRKAGGFNTVSTRAREEHKNVLVSKNEDLYKAYLIAHELGMEWYRASARVPGTAIHKTLVQWRRNLSNQLNQDRSSNLNHLQTRTFKLFNTLSSGITFPVPGEVARSQDWYSPWYHMYHLENTATGSGFDCLWSLMPSDDDLRKMVPEQFAERLCTPWSLNQYMTDGKGVIKKIQDGHGLYTTDIENARYYKDMIAMGIRAMYKPVSVAASTSGGKKPPSSVTDEIKSFASTVTIAAIDASPLALAFVERNIFLKARAISAPELIHKGSGSSSIITKTSQKSATRELPLYFPVSYFWLLNSHSNRGAPKKDLKGSRSPPFDVPHNGATRETESKFLVPANARMDYPGRESLVANLVFHGIISDKQGHEDYPFLGFPRVVNPWIGQQEIPLHALRRLVRMMVIVRLMHPNGQVASTPLDWLSALGNMMGTYDPKPFLYTDFKEIGKNGEDISGLARQPLRAHTRASDRSNPFPGGYAFYFYDALLAVYRHVQLVFEQLYQDRDQNPRRSDTAPKLFEPPLGTPKPKLPTLKSLADKANDVLLDSVASETNNGALTALKQAYAFFIKSKDECEAWFREADIAFRKRQVVRFDAMIKESTTETKIASHQKAKEHQQVKLAEAIKKAASEKKNFILKHGYAPQSTMNPSFLNQSSARQRQQQQRDEVSTLTETATEASASSSLLSLAQGEEAQEFDVDDFVNEGIEQEQQQQDKRKKQGTRDTNKEEEEVKEEPRGKKSKQDEQDTKAQKGSSNNKGNRAHAFAYMAQGGSSSDSRETRASDFFKYQVLRELCAVAKQQNRIPATPLNALVSRVYSAGRLFVYVGMFYDRLLTNEAWGKMVDKYFIPGIDAGNQASTDDKFLPEPVPDYGNVAKKQPRHHLQIREILIKKKSKKGIRKEEANKAKEAKKEAKKTLAQKDKASKQAQPNASNNPSAVLPVESSTVDQETQDVDMKHNIFAEPPRLVSVSERAPAASDVSSVLSISTPTPVAVGIPSTPTVPERKIIAARTLAPSVAVSASSAVPMASATPIVKPSLALTSPLAVLPRPAPPIPRSKAKIIPATKQRRSLIDASLERMSE